MHAPDPDTSDAAVAGALAAEDGTALVSESDLAAAAGLPPAVVEAVVREGLLRPRVTDPAPLYATSDVEVLRAGMELLEAGLPLAELLELARRFDAAMGVVAEDAVELFARFVRDPAAGTAVDEDEVATRQVDALQRMLPATSRLVAHRFRALVRERAERRLRTGS